MKRWKQPVYVEKFYKETQINETTKVLVTVRRGASELLSSIEPFAR
jgi:hypothetical protein